jgi:hypothetical protein
VGERLGDEHQYLRGALEVMADHLQDSHGAVKRLVQAEVFLFDARRTADRRDGTLH